MKNEIEFEHFLRANERRIHYQIHRLGIHGESYADFYAEGVLALWKTFQTYEAGRSEIGTYLNYQIRYRLIDLLRKRIRDQEVTDEAVQEEVKLLDNGNRHRASGMPVMHGSGIVLKEPAFWKEIKGRLTEKQWKWVEYFIIADLSVKEIMEIENVSADTVKSWGKTVRKKLRDPFLRKKLEEMIGE